MSDPKSKPQRNDRVMWFRVPGKLGKRLDAFAQKNQVTKQEVIRQMIKYCLSDGVNSK